MWSTKEIFLKALTKENILRLVTEQDLLQYYVLKGKDFNKAVKCPFHNDKTPSLRVEPSRKIFKCFGCGAGGDVFHYIEKKYSLSFIQVLSLINNDFRLGLGTKEYIKPSLNYVGLPNPSYKEEFKGTVFTQIEVKVTNWNKANIKYWEGYGYTLKLLKIARIFPLEWYRVIDGYKSFTFNSKGSYGYFVDKGVWKILNTENKKEYKWFTNMTSNHVHGDFLLPKTHKLLIITKSLKDSALLCNYGIPSCSPASENTLLPENIIEDYRSRFETIVTFFDYDIAGIKLARKYWRYYNIPYLFLPDGSKDFSGFRKSKGEKQTLELVKNLKQLYVQ
jgi:hypothetical protein